MVPVLPQRSIQGARRRLLADDGTVLAAEHQPRWRVRGGSDRSLAVVIVHGFMARAHHPRTLRIAGWLRRRAAVVLRHAALYGDVDAVAAVSGPGRWYYRGTPGMRLLHWLVLAAPGRVVLRLGRRARITRRRWAEPLPMDPAAAASEITVPVLVVHGRQDHLIRVDHAWEIDAAAGGRATLWVLPSFGHAEAGVDEPLVSRIGEWLEDACLA